MTTDELEAWSRVPRRRAGRRLVAALLAALLILAGGGAVLDNVLTPHTTTTAAACPGSAHQFAGYVARQTVDEISGQWSVPTIAATSPPGQASTWIGAQAPTGSFVQVGTDEADTSGLATYDVFWSDPRVDFHAQQLAVVPAGTQILASMQQVHGSWELKVDDGMTTLTKLLGYAGSVAFRQAEWFQEDPGTGCLGNAPYPATASVAFSGLRVDNAVPELTFGDGEVLEAADGVILVPSPLHNDSFTLQAPRGVALQYLRDVAIYNTALGPFNELRRQGAPATKIEAAVPAVEQALRRDVSLFHSQSWPAKVPLAPLIALDKQLLAELRTTVAAYVRTASRGGGLSDAIRYALGLPPAVPASISPDPDWR